MSQTQNSSNQEQQQQGRSLAEWVSFGIASFILVASAGLVVHQWLTKEDSPPILSVTRTEAIRKAQGHFYVPFAVTNTGGGTAASVQVIAELRFQGKVEATGEQQFDFLSNGETEKGAFVFNRNPRDGELILRVTSYKLP
jgi:uncharacterized protein (TIGR02588 family)